MGYAMKGYVMGFNGATRPKPCGRITISDNCYEISFCNLFCYCC